MRGGQWGVGWQGGSILISQGLRVCLFLWDAGPTCTLSIMESDIRTSMDPQSAFGNFAFVGPFVCLLSMSRSPDLMVVVFGPCPPQRRHRSCSTPRRYTPSSETNSSNFASYTLSRQPERTQNLSASSSATPRLCRLGAH